MGSLLRLLGILILTGGSGLGCATCPHTCGTPIQDVAYLRHEPYPAVDAPVAAGLTVCLPNAASVPPPCVRPLQVLVLSGGVAGAPFSAGVLAGWSESGTRPRFDVVTGISSGALIGAFAFLGPKYDAPLRQLIMSLNSDDLFRFRPLRCMLRHGAFGSAKPAELLMRRVFDDCYLADLRQAHAEGRRFFVGTMNLETKRLVIWDVGALASSGRPDAGDLVRKVLLAAVSWPGAVPPVEFDVEGNGHCCREQHCDAGSVAMAFLRFGSLPGWPEPGAPVRPGWLAGSDLYVLASRKLYSDPAKVPNCAWSRLAPCVSSIFEALTRSDVAHLYPFCAVSGMRYHLLSVPCDFQCETPSTCKLFPREAGQLFDTGRQISVNGGPRWRTIPPGAGPGEEAVPRDGSEIKMCHW